MSAVRITTPVAGRQLSAAPPELYATSDFYLACFLRCAGYELAATRRDGRRCTFLYRDRAGRAADVLAFYSDRASIPPLRFVGAIRAMKALLHDAG